MKHFFFVSTFFLLFWNQSIASEAFPIEMITLLGGDPTAVEKSWLVEWIPIWKKEEESRLETYLKKILSIQLKNPSFPPKEKLKTELKKIPNLGGIRIRNQKSTLFYQVSYGAEFPNLSQIRSFTIKGYYVDFYLGRQTGIVPVEFLKTGLTCAFYYFSENETLLYSQESSEWKIKTEKSLGELNSFFKIRNTNCQGCEKIRLVDGTLFFFPSQSGISFWFRLGINFFLFVCAFILTIFFFRNFWIRNRETLRKAIQTKKNLDQEKKSILSQ
ncbi:MULTISPECIES: hypothetical protein [Leptospira]|nr:MULTISPECIES: hypothetical protein [Leptospira]AXX15870.1 hypothetical protein C4Q31_10215 [Leptospira borgpetersenii serovar Ceylonica]MDQ7244003.1 hypothetical protein [Leptospira borgpetersenii]QVK48872.1 hypothetical protein FH601_06105 [Leptospira borgpetersenii]QVK49761.1 hypothetical protein FH600_08140 [Leptospira borgpetersenii]QVK52949.1 hypothetical protein FH599_08135 [Leptospira borgpetersenii]